MPDQPTDVTDRGDDTVLEAVVPVMGPQTGGPAAGSGIEVTGPTVHPRTEGRRRRRTDWRLGGRSVRRWRGLLLAWSLLSVGAGMLAGFAVLWFWPTAPWAGPTSTGILWLSMLVPVVVALRMSRPIGLLRLRPIDLLYGVALGALLRVAQGWIGAAAGRTPEFPEFTTLNGQLPPMWWLTDAVPAVLVAPVLEEFFFRVVILVAIYAALRRAFGGAAAGFAAAMISTGLFIVVHAIAGALTWDSAITLGAVGLTCALLVLLTGRIWGAVLVHIVYNATLIALGVIGTLFA